MIVARHVPARDFRQFEENTKQMSFFRFSVM